MRRVVTLLLVGTLVSACAPAASKSPPHAQAAPVEPELDRAALQATLFELADAGMRDIDQATRDVLGDPRSTRDARALALATRTDVATALVDGATRGAPESALAAMVNDVAQSRAALDQLLASRASDAPEQALGAAMARIDERVQAAASRAPATDNVASEDARAHARSDRLQFVLQHAPTFARWEAEAFVSAALAQPDVQRGVDGLEAGRASIDRLATALDDARKTATTIEEHVASARPEDFAAAKDLVTEVRAAMADAKEVLPKTETSIIELREAVASAERVTTALKDLTTGPDGKPLDLSGIGAASERFVTAAADLRAAMQQANELLASDEPTRRLQDFAATGRASVDHVTFRVALLMVVAASLAVVLMVVRSLTRPRAEPAARAPRR